MSERAKGLAEGLSGGRFVGRGATEKLRPAAGIDRYSKTHRIAKPCVWRDRYRKIQTIGLLIDDANAVGELDDDSMFNFLKFIIGILNIVGDSREAVSTFYVSDIQSVFQAQ